MSAVTDYSSLLRLFVFDTPENKKQIMSKIKNHNCIFILSWPNENYKTHLSFVSQIAEYTLAEFSNAELIVMTVWWY